MSHCMHCGTEMHPFDASFWEDCAACRHKRDDLRTVRRWFGDRWHSIILHQRRPDFALPSIDPKKKRIARVFFPPSEGAIL